MSLRVENRTRKILDIFQTFWEWMQMIRPYLNLLQVCSSLQNSLQIISLQNFSSKYSKWYMLIYMELDSLAPSLFQIKYIYLLYKMLLFSHFPLSVKRLYAWLVVYSICYQLSWFPVEWTSKRTELPRGKNSIDDFLIPIIEFRIHVQVTTSSSAVREPGYFVLPG